MWQFQINGLIFAGLYDALESLRFEVKIASIYKRCFAV